MIFLKVTSMIVKQGEAPTLTRTFLRYAHFWALNASVCQVSQIKGFPPFNVSSSPIKLMSAYEVLQHSECCVQ